MYGTFIILVKLSCRSREYATTPDRRQSKTVILTIDERRSKSLETVFDCHLWPDWRQMTIENTVSSDFRSAFVDCKSVFDCRLSGLATCSQHPEQDPIPCVIKTMLSSCSPTTNWYVLRTKLLLHVSFIGYILIILGATRSHLCADVFSWWTTQIIEFQFERRIITYWLALLKGLLSHINS